MNPGQYNEEASKTVEKNGQRFDLGDSFEVDCFQLGRHDWGQDGNDDEVPGMCRHCFRRKTE